jgi:hypothetical protein
LNANNKVAIAAAGSIPRLVQLLSPGCVDAPKEFAALALDALGDNVTNRVAIAAAGASAGVDVLAEMKRLVI